MDEGENGLPLTFEERGAGFSAQTLTYPEQYDLPLAAKGARRLVRCVALVLDAENRLRRRHFGPGYVHEQWGPTGWTVVEEFETLSDVLKSDTYRASRRSGTEDPAGTED